MRQKDLDESWVKKNDTNYCDYKIGICIDAEHGFISRFLANPANVNDDYLWADSTYSGEQFKQLLNAAAIERNSVRNQIGA